MDELEVKIDKNDYISWTKASGFQPIQFWINGENLLSRVQFLEIPMVAKEREVDVENNGDSIPAGDYLGIGVEYAHGVLSGADLDCGEVGHESARSLIFGCTCGVSECWAILVKVEVDGDKVVWRNFQQIIERTGSMIWALSISGEGNILKQCVSCRRASELLPEC